MKEMLKKKSGITLVALVVTIVILIILATISVNLVINGGLINKTQNAANLDDLAREKERLELVKGQVAADVANLGKVTVDNYVAELIKEGITVEAEVTDNGDGSKTVITDTGYSVTIVPKGDRDVEIIIDGKAGALPPRITNVKPTRDDNAKTIKIEIEAIRTEGATYSYYYKTETGEWTTVEENSTKTSVTITGIKEEETYIIKAVAKNEHGQTEKEITVKTDEEESVANAPRLSEGMTPVKWNGTNWIKTTESDTEWYNYAATEKKWANVVLGDASWKADGVTLDEDANYSMLVWIPRYAYKINSMYHQNGNSTTAGKMSIVFINTANVNSVTGTEYTRDTKEEYPEAITNEAMADYVVHPAFDFGGTKLPGFWVGKYESSFVGTGTTLESGCSNDASKTMMIKANVASWRSITISNIFDVCLNMNKASNVHGLPTSDAVVDPHQMKNDECGAVAYLSKSRYGKNNEEVYINNNSNYITGIAGDTASASSSTATTNTYKTEAGQKASTNGNTTGVYDMSGGAWEYTASYVNNGHDNLNTYGASLVGGANKYKNVYTSTTTSGANTQAADYALSTPANGHYGDAVYETSNNSDGGNSWYADYTAFPWSSFPFFLRCGHSVYRTGAGVFSFYHRAGGADGNDGFRVVVPVL